MAWGRRGGDCHFARPHALAKLNPDRPANAAQSAKTYPKTGCEPSGEPVDWIDRQQDWGDRYFAGRFPRRPVSATRNQAGCGTNLNRTQHAVSALGRVSLALVDTKRRPNGPRVASVGADFSIAPQCFFADIAAGVIEVNADGAVADSPAAHAGVDQSLAQLAVFASPFHPLVEAVDAHQIGLPSGRVVAVPGGAVVVRASSSTAASRAGRQFPELAIQRHAVRRPASAVGCAAAHDVFARDSLGSPPSAT